jgi:hypothetical protein
VIFVKFLSELRGKTIQIPNAKLPIPQEMRYDEIRTKKLIPKPVKPFSHLSNNQYRTTFFHQNEIMQKNEE